MMENQLALNLLLLRKKNVIKATTRFMFGILLTFAKLSLKSFIYTLAEILFFPNATVKEIYKKYKIERIIIYHILTDTDSTSLQFIILSDTASDFPKSKIRNVIFEVIVKTEIFKRFDTCHSFWQNFNARKSKRQKNLGSMKLKEYATHVMLL